MLFTPVEAGYWRQHETFDGTYTLDDLFDILEVIQVKSENERRAEEAESREREVNRHGGI